MRYFIVLLFFLSALRLHATDYYVSKDGLDTNPGTESLPFLTIGKAASLMIPGDVCFIKEGIYREELSPANSGTAGALITFKAFEGDTVVISATEPVGAWSNHTGNIYKASVTMPLGIERNMLYASGKAMDLARWPDNADNDPYTIDATLVENGSESHVEGTGIPAIDWTGGYMWYLGAHSGASWTRKITSSASNRINYEAINPNKWPFNPHNPTIVRNGNRGRFYLFGKLEALDHPGEWFYDETDNMLYFNAPGDVDPGSVVTEVATREKTVALDKDYILIDAIQLFGGRVHIAADHCVVRNCVVTNGFQSLDELDNTDAQQLEGAVTIEGSFNLIERNLIQYGSGNGVSMLFFWKGSTSNTVTNNIIRHFNTIGIHASPIRSNTPETAITKNTIYSCGRDGIYVSGQNTEVSFNDVSECMRMNNDGGIFYTVGNDDDKNSVIHHNWFHDSEGPDYADGRAAGIYLDNHSKGYKVHHNMVWNVTWTGLQINWDNWNLAVQNNSFYQVEEAMGRWANGFTLKEVEVANNYASHKDWIGTDIKNNIIDAESPFISFEDQNFSPIAGSSLIDAGIEIEGITDGFLGSKPDIGAYESGGEKWVPGADWTVADDRVPDEGEGEEILSLDEDHKLNHYVRVIPNPVSASLDLFIDVPYRGDVFLALYGPGGQLILEETKRDTLPGEYKIRLNVEGMSKGVYFLKYFMETGDIMTRRIVKL
ncbi:hypothetical protein FNH22_16020 [Fulvivirga sp. M361]|uniref:right-handed parallel beta-helix repeat-containing protein n=1 Tax=Fulvivirga sp. M361 TaxID=2594266 RepID=UPI00117A37FC|nr:right-handed parallel beta-helix repeat-containing protein [Fulvivirga sp. M361]TRX57642.1 hypothetical protein FNH22_16020 [Fulvivirga sp. M361]